ncbi:MAG: phospholipase [Flavisolibacter sp.]|nr:phospholipase [Flavisolibacter sp.]
MLTDREKFRKGHLLVRPRIHVHTSSATIGQRTLGIDAIRDALLYVPKNYDAAQPTPLAVMLHGAGGNAAHGLSIIHHLADAHNIILLAPYARSSSWDIIHDDQYGRDIIFINQALENVFSEYVIDTKRIAIGGFSDGASYALCVGLTNGDLFTHILAFSPGFAFTSEVEGKPRIFISHGVQDDVLPINPCSRRIVPRLRKQGYEVIYEEFDGTHVLPPFVSEAAVRWFLM